MKKLLLIISLNLVSMMAFGIDLNTQCFSIVDELDRDYCHKKRMRLLKKQLSSDQSTWGRTLSLPVKEKKQSTLRLKISQKQSELSMLQDEVKLYKNHQNSLNAAKTIVIRRKKKKKKKKRNFLNIKL